MLGAEIVAESLERNGIRWIFGIPGTHNIELYEAIAARPSLEAVLVTHELSAAFMACGVARAAGRLAAVNLVPGAGLTHALSGIAESYLDQIPMLVILSGVRSDTGAAFQLHDVDQASVVRPLAKRVLTPCDARELRHAMEEAVACAMAPPRGPAVVIVPANVFIEREENRGQGAFANKPSMADEFPVISDAEINAVVERLNASNSVSLYVGVGAETCADILPSLAEELDALVYTTLSAKGVFPENHPRWAWNTMGMSAPTALRALESEFDCVLAIGCRFGEVATGSYGFAPPRELIHVDIDSSVFNRNYRASLCVKSDARLFVEALQNTGRLRVRESNLSKLESLARAHSGLRSSPSSIDRGGVPVRPDVFYAAIQKVFGEEAIFVTDSGSGTFSAMEHLRLNRVRSFLAPVDYSAMGFAVPAAMGAKLACPSRPVVAVVGDGAFLMTGMELLTARERGVGLLVCVLRDRELGQISAFQSAALGRKLCTSLPFYDLQRMAAAVGSHYLCVESGKDLESVLDCASKMLRGGTSLLLEVPVDPSAKTHFSRGVVRTNFERLGWDDRIRIGLRRLGRVFTHP